MLIYTPKMKCAPFPREKRRQLQELSLPIPRVNGGFHDRNLFRLNQTPQFGARLPGILMNPFPRCLQISRFPRLSANLNEFLRAVHILEQLRPHVHTRNPCGANANVDVQIHGYFYDA